MNKINLTARDQPFASALKPTNPTNYTQLHKQNLNEQKIKRTKNPTH